MTGDLTAVIVLVEQPPRWADLPMASFLEHLGETYLVRLGPWGTHLLVLTQMDLGFLEYDPVVSNILHELAYLVKLKERDMAALEAELKPARSLVSMQKFQLLLEERCSPINEVIRRKVKEATKVVSALRSLRLMGHEEQLVEAEVRAGVVVGEGGRAAAKEVVRLRKRLQKSRTVQA